VLQELRRAGIPADGGLFGRSLKAQMSEANGRGARLALILGEEEVRGGKVSVKYLEESRQYQLPRAEVVPSLKKFVEPNP